MTTGHPPVPGRRHVASDLVTVDEVARRMRVSKMTVYRMIHAGELPAKRVRRAFRVPVRAVEQYLRDADVVASTTEDGQ